MDVPNDTKQVNTLKKTLLLIDDEEINLFVLTRLFENRFTILSATSSEDALKIIDDRGTEIDAVLSDVNLPESNGVQLLKEARTFLPDAHFFLLTGYEMNEELEAALQDNLVIKIFKKPFKRAELEETFNTYLQA